MLIRRVPGWAIKESEATPEHVFMNRRRFMGAAAGVIGAGSIGSTAWAEKQPRTPDPTADLYPAMRNEEFKLDRPITSPDLASTYNNFYEYGSHKKIYRDAQRLLKTRPWTVTIDGDVENPQTFDIDTLIRQVPLEERLYRLRCVEAWSMAVPWTGFPLAKLLALVNPLSSAKYVRFETFHDKKMAPGQRAAWYPWPYTEGLTIAEAANELPFLVTGVYGKPLPAQFGAPIRLALPWKYGFKSIKSIVRISFTKDRPATFWQDVQGNAYGFWANVNPDVPHKRWSQATERVLGTDERRPTLMFNGYADYVTDIYKGLENEPLYF
jgi:sulfoxide reductase catalytic subunit YedY